MVTNLNVEGGKLMSFEKLENSNRYKRRNFGKGKNNITDLETNLLWNTVTCADLNKLWLMSWVYN